MTYQEQCQTRDTQTCRLVEQEDCSKEGHQFRGELIQIFLLFPLNDIHCINCGWWYCTSASRCKRCAYLCPPWLCQKSYQGVSDHELPSMQQCAQADMQTNHTRKMPKCSKETLPAGAKECSPPGMFNCTTQRVSDCASKEMQESAEGKV